MQRADSLEKSLMLGKMKGKRRRGMEKEMATHSSVLAYRIPGMGEPGGLPSMGSHRVGHDWSNLAAAAACPLSWWCHPPISFSVACFSSCLQSFPASDSFQMNQLFISGGQSIGVLDSASVLPMNIQGWLPLVLTGLIYLQSKGLSLLCGLGQVSWPLCAWVSSSTKWG